MARRAANQQDRRAAAIFNARDGGVGRSAGLRIARIDVYGRKAETEGEFPFSDVVAIVVACPSGLGDERV
jgi:hypothetical protein